MKVIASAEISGPEARGKAQIIWKEEGQYELQLSQFWVAPGAPDVRVVLSQNANGQIDESMREVGPLPGGNFETSLPFDNIEYLLQMKTIIVYCKKFSVHFGHGELKFQNANPN